MAHTWTENLPGSSVYLNHVLSDQLYEGAFEKAEVINWVTPAGGFGKKKGESFNILTITGPDEPTSALLQENVRIPTDRVTMSGTTLTVAEFGRAIEHTNLFDELSKYDLKNRIQKRLREVMRLSLDYHSGLKFKDAKHCYTATSVNAGTTDTDGTHSVAAAAALSVFHCQAIRDLLYGTLKAPFFGDGDTYISLASWPAMRGLRSDPQWKEWYTLGHPEKLEKGEVGQIESIRFIETNHDTVLKNVVVSGITLGEALFFGDEAVAFIEAQSPELRIKVGDDYGRQQGVAWYGVLQWGLFHPTANAREARVVRFGGNNF
jgi:N4-gp56 family major capsid protein